MKNTTAERKSVPEFKVIGNSRGMGDGAQPHLKPRPKVYRSGRQGPDLEGFTSLQSIVSHHFRGSYFH